MPSANAAVTGSPTVRTKRRTRCSKLVSRAVMLAPTSLQAWTRYTEPRGVFYIFHCSASEFCQISANVGKPRILSLVNGREGRSSDVSHQALDQRSTLRGSVLPIEGRQSQTPRQIWHAPSSLDHTHPEFALERGISARGSSRFATPTTKRPDDWRYPVTDGNVLPQGLRLLCLTKTKSRL